MDDLEITKLCAEAMVMKPDPDNGLFYVCTMLYDPLHNDAQAMALVKKFPIQTVGAIWKAIKKHDPLYGNLDINRVVCECVANGATSPPPET